MSNRELTNVIGDFERLVHLSDTYLREAYGIKIPLILARRQGLVPVTGAIPTSLGDLDFRFHGQGCRVLLNGKIVDFDYDIDTSEYVYFDMYKLYDFYKSSMPSNDTFEEFKESIFKAEKLDLLQAINSSNTSFISNPVPPNVL